MKNSLLLVLFFFSISSLPAQILNVPGEYSSIQAAIDAAEDGDTVLVQPGEYFENIRFRGKSIVLTGRYYLTGSAEDIAGTIINGSQPAHPDTASCILIVDGESPSTVVQGFTLTGGTGTRWLDPHGAGTYREGGGILTEGTSPTIQFNIIRDNVINNTTAVVSTGGGGIRCGDGDPVIRNNWIHHNIGRYGGGIVLNFCTGNIYNNVVAWNEGGQDFGGAGLWFTGTNTNTVVNIFNNTVAFNQCIGSGTYGGKGGGIFVFSIRLKTWNNIIWGNTQTSGGPIANFSGSIKVDFTNITSNYPGSGNLNLDPLFADSLCFALKYSSPCIDAADTTEVASFDQVANAFDAAFPSLGSRRGDMGASGGQWASSLPCGGWPLSRFEKITAGDIVNTPSDSRSVNLVDVNADSWEDVFISNGPGSGQDNMLYLNNGDGTFTTVSGDPIVQDNGKSDGATFADADNDGDLDALVVTWYGQINFFYRNNGDGTFTYEPDIAMGNTGTYSETASWGDYDNDGLLDLYVTNSEGDKRNLLYQNLGNGDFQPVTQGDWVSETDLSRSVNWTDFDGDGDLDLYVSNENNTPNYLYRNDGDGIFSKVTGIAIVQGNRSSMSSSWGDVDNDGDLDLFVANAGFFQEQNNELFLNQGDGTFLAATSGDPVTDGGCSYGSNFGDFDNDGDLDLLVTNGFCNGTIRNFLYRNTGDGTFERDEISISDLTTTCSFGTAWGDLNNDGWLDLVVANCMNSGADPQPPNAVFINEGGSYNWLKVSLEGTVSNRSAIGAKVWVKATFRGQSVWQLREISAQSGYCGQNSLIAHFGLENALKADSLLIEFPSGVVMTLGEQPANTQINILEDMIDHTSGITRLNAALQLKCFPNPASKLLQVEINLQQSQGMSPLRLRLTDATGRRIWMEQVEGAGPATPVLLQIPLEKLSPGVYQLSTSWKDHLVTEKVVVL